MVCTHTPLVDKLLILFYFFCNLSLLSKMEQGLVNLLFLNVENDFETISRMNMSIRITIKFA